MKTNFPIRLRAVAILGLATLALPCVLPAFGQVTNGLLLHYKLDGNALDSSPSANNGTASGISYVPGATLLTSQAASFDGTSSYIQAASGLPDMQSATISAWLFLPTLDTNLHVVLYEDSSATNGALQLYFDGPANKLGCQVKSGENILFSTPPIGEWFHVAAVADAVGDTLQLWINGVMTTNFAWTGRQHRNALQCADRTVQSGWRTCLLFPRGLG